jgi:hypothetical protein
MGFIGAAPFSGQQFFGHERAQRSIMKAEYKEGPEAREKFEEGMRKLFQASKQQAPAKPKPKRKRKVKPPDRD